MTLSPIDMLIAKDTDASMSLSAVFSNGERQRRVVVHTLFSSQTALFSRGVDAPNLKKENL